MTTLKSLAIAGAATIGAYMTAKYGAGTLTSLHGWLHPRPLAPAVSEGISRVAPPIATSPVEIEPWVGVLLTDAVDLTARLETRVTRIRCRVGDEIHEGDILAELDTSTQEHEIAAAAAAVRVSEAEAWRAGVSVHRAEDRRRRRAQVFKVGGADMPLVSAEELADSNFDKLAAGAQAGAASATAAERRAQLAYLQQIVHEATIRAPYDGVIATQYVMPGAHVRQGMPVIRIIGRGAMRVRFAVPEAEAKALHTGAQVTVAWDSRALEGTIDRVAPEVESASSSIVMEAIVDAPPLNGEERSALAGRVVSVRAVDAR